MLFWNLYKPPNFQNSNKTLKIVLKIYCR